jgi:histidine ammonia-lyase
MIKIGTHTLSIYDFGRAIFDHEHLDLDELGLHEVDVNFNFLSEYSRSKLIYGINTGLGPMAQYKINEKDQHQLQYNLIRSHSSGSGPRLDDQMARATMLARLNSFMKASSGVHPSLPLLLKDMLNAGLIPTIFEKGGVGASGDLVQLAHLALNLIGEGDIKSGDRWLPAQQAFQEKNLTPLKVQLREGLAIMNGTSAMTGIGILSFIRAQRLLRCSVILSSITNEIMRSFDDHFSEGLNSVKGHEGQRTIARQMREWLSDSQMIRHRPDHLYNKVVNESVLTDKVQEYYSLRCVPQILGPVADTLREVEIVLENELNSVSDNPVIDHRRENVYHGGNFHGDYVALAMDKLKIAITKLSMLSERQLNYLLNDKLNRTLPPFINIGTPGLNFGLQGIQFTATSTTAENQTLSYPMYLHSISNNNDNQDIVSMGTNAALLAHRVVDNSFIVLAIQTMAVMQAIDYLQCLPKLSSNTQKVYDQVRAVTNTITDDRPLHEDIVKLKDLLFQLGSTQTSLS